MSSTKSSDPFAALTANFFKVDTSATSMLIDVNRALMASGERAFAVQRDAAGEVNSELSKLAAIRDPSELPAGQIQYANAMGKLAMSVVGEMFDIQRDLQKELTDIVSGAFTAAATNATKVVEEAKTAAEAA